MERNTNMKKVSECKSNDFNVDEWCTSMSGREQVYNAVVTYIKEHQYPPSVRELCEITGLRSTSTIHSHLTRLIRDGRLETDSEPGTPRALRVPGYQFVKQEAIANVELDSARVIAELKKHENPHKYPIERGLG